MPEDAWRQASSREQQDYWRSREYQDPRSYGQYGHDPYAHWHAGPSTVAYPGHQGYDYRGYDDRQHYSHGYSQQIPDWRQDGSRSTANGYHEGYDWRYTAPQAHEAHHQQQYRGPQQEYAAPSAYYREDARYDRNDYDNRPPNSSVAQHRRYEPAPRWNQARANAAVAGRAGYSTEAAPTRPRHDKDALDSAPSHANQDRRGDSMDPDSWRSRNREESPRPNGNGRAPLRRSHSRPVDQHAIGQILKPRLHYLQQSAMVPKSYPADREPPKPRPLLVLDLNGTLVFRPGDRSTNAAQRSASAVHRPYLACFLQYCLALDSPKVTHKKRASLWASWDEENEQTRNAADAKQGDTSPSRHGTHFWAEAAREPEPPEEATYRLLLWSSARPENVNLMARTIFAPAQAEHLLRVYARDTLLVRRLYGKKSPSIKDLEILWAALNDTEEVAASGSRGTSPLNDEQDEAASEVQGMTIDSRSRGERRLFADVREKEGQAHDGERQQFEESLHELWRKHIILPTEQDGADGTFTDGQGYGPHNTLLLDDSTDKAALQPYNHVLVPEFDKARAEVAVAASSQHSESAEDKMPDDVLLQVIGVLEHARYQRNVSAWIRMGGLGDFGGMAEKHPYYNDEELLGVESAEAADRIAKEAAEYFSESVDDDSKNSDKVLPRLRAHVEDRTQHFWASEGCRALQRRGIEIRKF